MKITLKEFVEKYACKGQMFFWAEEPYIYLDLIDDNVKDIYGCYKQLIVAKNNIDKSYKVFQSSDTMLVKL